MKKPLNNNVLSRAFFYLSCIFLAASLTSCGGGGGGTPTVTIGDVSVAEGNSGTTDLVFTLNLSSAAGSGASVAYATSNNSATAGSDYTASSGTLNITSGSTSATITISVTGDTAIENDETLTLTLSSASGVSLGADTLTATGTISNDDNGGYYDGTGSIDDPVLTITDLQAIVDNDRILITSITNDLLYNLTVTSRSGSNYTASARIYKDGVFVRTASVSGTQTSGSSMTGIITGTGQYTSGSFNLTYSLINSRAPLVFANGEIWNDTIPFSVVLTFASNTMTDLVDLRDTSSSNITGCDVISATLANVNSEQPGRVRTFSGNYENCSLLATNGTATQGYFTTFDGGELDSDLLFIIFNDDDAHIDILN